MRNPEESMEYQNETPDGWVKSHKRVQSSKQEPSSVKSTMDMLSFDAIREQIAAEDLKNDGGVFHSH